jgi:hypothetical protein
MTATELCRRAALDDQARELAKPDVSARAYVEQLAAGGRLREAIAGLAQLLPNREAVAWGLESIRRVPAAKEQPAEAVERWLADANDETRRAALAAAERAGIGTPAGCLSLAIFFSGGSLAPPDTQVAPEPEPHLCLRMVAGAIAMAVALDPPNAADHFRAILDRGFHLAKELKIWEEK